MFLASLSAARLVNPRSGCYCAENCCGSGDCRMFERLFEQPESKLRPLANAILERTFRTNLDNCMYIIKV